MRTTFLLLFALSLTFWACDNSAPADEAAVAKDDKSIVLETKILPQGDEPNPAAEGFDAKASSPKAIMIADSIMKYHGGRQAWDEARFFHWNFFGARTLTWDKHESRVRIDVPKENKVYLLDYSGEELAGKVRVLGDEVTDAEVLTEELSKAYSMFINDAFWLVQQFKLKDAGVILQMADEQIDPQASRPSFVIDQTFDQVGDTPQNRYRLFVDKVTYRINTWQFFRNAEDTEPAIETPWNGYYPHDDILISSDRGGRFQLTEVSVKKQMNERVFTEFE